MNHSKNLNYMLIGLLFFTMLFLAASVSACERMVKITIENRCNQDIMIYYTVVRGDGTLGEATYQGIVSANSTKTQTIILIKDEDVKRIEAKDPSGNVVSSNDYNRAELEKIDWKIVISP